MVKITLYNIGGYKKKQVFYCFVGFFCIHSICILNIQKVKRRHVFRRKNTSASMLRIHKNKNRITLRALALNKHIISVSFYDVRFHIDNQYYILCFKKTLSIMALPCIFCIQKNRCMYSKKHIYNVYIYIY